MHVNAAAVPTTRVQASRRVSVDFDDLPFGQIFSDHMFVATYADGAWRDAEFRPYGPLEVYATSRALQYGVSLFEGFKAHKTPEGDAAIFRPEDNWRRLNRTARRLVMPEVPKDLFFGAMFELIELDRAWLPEAHQGALYIRPTYFCTDPNLMVQPGSEFRFVIMTGPMGPYFGGELALVTTREYVRAFPGGTGDVKPCGNYAGTLLATVEAQRAGYQNVIWLDGVQRRYVEECGVMNVFFVIDGVAVTPSLEDGTILPGITRDSVIRLLADFGVPCEERRVTVDELLERAAAGTLSEAFGVGTAAIVAPIHRLGLDGTDVELDDPPDSLARRLKAELVGIQTGRIEDRHGWLTRV